MMQHERLPSGLTRMSEGGRFEVSEEDPDPRGWSVVSGDGQRLGEVKDLIVDEAAMKVRFFEVELDEPDADDRRVLVDAREADLSNNRQVIVHADSGAEMLHSSSLMGRSEYAAPEAVAHDRGHVDEAARMTRSEEEVSIGTREVESGEVILNKTVETEHVREPIERRVQRVRVERRPVREARGSDAVIEGDEIRVPIVEEEVVVEKRPVVKEEIVVARDVGTETEVVETDVRKERVDVREEDKPGRPASRKGGRGGEY